jgi:hypothetical protein
MNSITQFENRASSRRSKHEGESSTALCDRLSRTRDTSQRQLPTDQDYAVSTREYQTDQSSLKPAPTAAGPVLDQQQRKQQRQRQPHRCAGIDSSLHIRVCLKYTSGVLSRGRPDRRRLNKWRADVHDAPATVGTDRARRGCVG